jgi:hypothetical protein
VRTAPRIWAASNRARSLVESLVGSGVVVVVVGGRVVLVVVVDVVVVDDVVVVLDGLVVVVVDGGAVQVGWPVGSGGTPSSMAHVMTRLPPGV